MAKVKILKTKLVKMVLFYCSACKTNHAPVIENYNGHMGPLWGWNESFDKPTFTPSIRVRGSYKRIKSTCHSFVTDGKIKYLSDCTHEYAGKTLELSEWED